MTDSSLKLCWTLKPLSELKVLRSQVVRVEAEDDASWSGRSEKPDETSIPLQVRSNRRRTRSAVYAKYTRYRSEKSNEI
jgi:hypothetical protein